MAINIVSMKCPGCGAALPVESGREFSFCSYCGTKVMLSNENEYIYRNIDEARIKEAETDRMIRLREMELKERENDRGRKAILVAYGVALAFVLIGAFICLFNPGAGLLGIFIGGYIGKLTYKKSGKKKKRNYVGTNEVQISESMCDYKDKNFNSVGLLFRGAGFTNVTAIPLNDLTMFNQKKNGQVESVTINGSEDFEEGDVFPKSSNVLITYHSKK